MSEQNKLLVRRVFEEIWNRGNLSVVDDHFSSDYLGHSSVEIEGPEGAKKLAAVMRNAFPNFQYTAEDQIAEGDRVVTFWTIRAKHEGELEAPPPAGQQITLTGTYICRIANGNIIEGWTNTNRLGMESDEIKTQNKENTPCAKQI